MALGGDIREGQAGMRIGRQMIRHMDRRAGRQTDGQTDEHMNKQTDGQTGWAGRQSIRQTDARRQVDRQVKPVRIKNLVKKTILPAMGYEH